MGKLLICVGLALLLHVQLGSSYILSCYFTSWGQYRPGNGKYLVSDLDPCLCDHIVYAFASMKDGKITTFDWDDVKLYGEVQALKNKNSNLKTILSLGGWNFDTAKFTTMVSSEATRQVFIDSVIKFLRGYEFDGLDIDWEYPTNSNNFYTTTMQEMRAAFEAEAKKTNRPRLLVTAAVGAGPGIISQSYQVPELGAALDYFHVMTYDYHGSWQQITGENSPLHAGPSDIKSYEKFWNMDYTMNYWKDQGAPAEKLLAGFATYGHTWLLASLSNTGVGAPAKGPAPAGPYTKTGGILSYYEICDFLKQGATQAWDSAQMVPYAFQPSTMVWVGYDNVKSVQAKTDWLKTTEFGGAMVWTLAMDDFSGKFCGEGKYPLIGAIKSGLGTGASCTPRVHPLPPVTASPSAGGTGFCASKANGVYADPKNKSSFYHCNNGQTNTQQCPGSLVFDTSCSCCNWA